MRKKIQETWCMVLTDYDLTYTCMSYVATVLFLGSRLFLWETEVLWIIEVSHLDILGRMFTLMMNLLKLSYLLYDWEMTRKGKLQFFIRTQFVLSAVKLEVVFHLCFLFCWIIFLYCVYMRLERWGRWVIGDNLCM